MSNQQSKMQGRPGTPEVDGAALALCQRISRALARNAATRRAWVSLGRGLRQYWAGRVAREQPALLGGGLRIEARLWEQIEAGIFWFGFPPEDLPALQAMRARLPEDAVVLDVGANIGAFSLPLATHARHGTVHAFEPASATAGRLRRHVALNRLDNVVVNQCAVGRHASTVSLWIPEARWKGDLYNTGRTSMHVGRHGAGWREEVVDCMRLDDYRRERGLDRVDAIKIDVEGGELDVLEGARDLLGRLRPFVVMEVNSAPLAAAGHAVSDITRFWRDLGYRIGAISAGGRVHWDRAPANRSGHQNICCAPAEADLP